MVIKKGEHLSPNTEFKKGFHFSPNTEFKKGKMSGPDHPLWKGGKYKLKIGYIMAYAPKHPRANENRVYEHILVAEKKLGRYLLPSEHVHHINGIKDDNRPENIIVCQSRKEHFKNHRKYERYFSPNIPKPKEINFKAIIWNKNRTKAELKISSKCIGCGKLFWKNYHVRVKGYCKTSCRKLKNENLHIEH